MNELLSSIKADLSDRRMLPAVVLVGACLVAALAYALLGGGSSSPSVGPVGPVSKGAGGLAVSATTPERAVAETTNGASEQRGGNARNPFAPLPGSEPAAKAATSGSSSASSTGSSSSGSSSPSSSSGGSAPESGSSEPKKSSPKKKAATKPAYDVAIEFGVVPPGTPPEAVTLTPYAKLKLQTALPSVKQPLIVFRGVTAPGKSATFTLVGEAILSGSGVCLPNAEHCQAFDLQPGKSEQLSYLQPSGEITVYELRVVSIAARKAAAASAHKAKNAARVASNSVWAVSKAGAALLREAGLVAVPFLRYSSQPGVLIFSAPKHRKGHAAKAHAALLPRRR